MRFTDIRTSKSFSRGIYILRNLRYCPLVWMFCGKCSNNFIMRTHYQCLRVIYYKPKSNHYNLRDKYLLKLNKCRTKTYGHNTAVFKGAIVWNNLPNQFMDAKTLAEFKTLIREWTQFSCTCYICS